ncbi:hypothetical protein Ssed_3859 [Shewanella sediminis HAW-EB3]|uniref:HTH cro/C1-type domain-containing protein n=1 Tax=Shewanella sediminis (strain HAW-EB3) TaxID=425104 RepID=A8G040_SHESH|nr:helix-turn-helix transcriptional regulator [Shewanella sediminis]ABV38463.1 hypothetical protein Ssed_3859 [Shewanella sediminis HAW-EB3]
MTLGNQIKHFRNERGYSQPELAELAGIEQSYLSKLENDKSVPSNDIFRQLLSALSLTTQEFVDSLDTDKHKQQLNLIPDIELLLAQKNKMNVQNLRRYLYISSILLIIGVTLFYTGSSKQLFSETRYQYQSHGLVMIDEPDDIFSSWPHRIDRALMKERRLEMENRKDNSFLLTTENRGPEFTVILENGKRHYFFDKEERIPRAINAWLQILGVLLVTSGLIGFLLEKRFNKL